MSTEIIKLTNPDDNMSVAQAFMEQYNSALAACENIKVEFEKELEYVKSLAATEDSLQAIKKQKAEHNKVFNEYDAQRKVIKKAVSAPYDFFNEKFAECIKSLHKRIDEEYKRKTAEVTDKLIAEKTENVRAYYDEYLAASGIVEDYGKFFSFETIGLKINLSANENKLREEVKAFIDRIGDDLALIETQEHADEIIYDYKRVGGGSYLSASTAIRSVDAKYKAIEETKAREAERQARRQAAAQAEKRVEQAAIPEPLEAPKSITKEEKPVRVKFWVEAKPSEIRALKEYMNNGGIKYGNLD